MLLVIFVVLLRIPLTVMWFLMCIPVGPVFGMLTISPLVSQPAIPLGLLTLNCVAFVALSPLRHRHVRMYLPLLAAGSVVFAYFAYGIFDQNSFAMTLAVIESVFFAGIAFLVRGCAMNRTPARERKLANGFSILGVVMPIATLLFLRNSARGTTRWHWEFERPVGVVAVKTPPLLWII